MIVNLFKDYNFKFFRCDFKAGMSVFFVAIPLCLGIAVACKMPIESGLIAGISGGIITGILSGSHTSVSGPAAGVVAMVLQISGVIGYSNFLLVVILAGVFQIFFGIAKLGRLSNYVPSSVINGLMVAIGVILLLKQIPHLVGYDKIPSGDFNFIQFNEHNTFSTIFHALNHIDITATMIGISSLSLLFWFAHRPNNFITRIIPSSFFVVILSSCAVYLCNNSNIPILFLENTKVIYLKGTEGGSMLQMMNYSNFANINLEIIKYGLILAIVVSLETILSVQTADKLDKQKRHTPQTREMIAQGCGNMVSGLFGGLPITSVVVRTSVNINSGGRTKVSAIIHGILLLILCLTTPKFINYIPISCLSAILIFSGIKLIKSASIPKIYKEGWQYFLPFLATCVCIVFTDILTGVLMGLVFGIFFVVKTNYVKSFSYIIHKYHAGNVLNINLPQEISFLNKPSLVRLLDSIPNDISVVINATNTDYIDHDALNAIREFTKVRSKLHGIKVSTIGFKRHYDIENKMHITATISKEAQENMAPSDVLNILKEGNKRFRKNYAIRHDFQSQLKQIVMNQHPIAIVLSCMDSRSAPEIIFDLGIGEILGIRIAGNIVNEDIIGSIEYGCKVLGVKLVVVLGHTSCGAVDAACSNTKLGNATKLIEKISAIIPTCSHIQDKKELIDEVAKINAQKTAEEIENSSEILHSMLNDKKIDIVSGIYDVKSGKVVFC